MMTTGSVPKALQGGKKGKGKGKGNVLVIDIMKVPIKKIAKKLSKKK